MTILIEDADTELLAHELARRRGKGLTEAVNAALEGELKRTRGNGDIATEILRIAKEYRSLPIVDDRPVEAFLDYDDDGLPR